MAASMRNLFWAVGYGIRSCCQSLKQIEIQHRVMQHTKERAVVCMQVRNSQYRKEFVEPLVRSELPADNKELGERNYLPIKAMKSSCFISSSHDPILEKFINSCLDDGKRSVAKEIVTEALGKVKLIQLEQFHKARDPAEKRRIVCDPIRIFHEALTNVRPVFKLMPHIKAGTIYQVPVCARPNQAQHMAFRWIRDSANEKPKNISFSDSLARELLDASQNKGKSIKKKLDLHKKCEQNKAYAHFIS